MATSKLGKEATMLKESFNGNDGFFGGNDGDAFSKFISSEIGPQTDSGEGLVENVQQAFQFEKEKSHLDIHKSNSRLDYYLFYFSSRL